jgi:hypothetical protein
MAHLSDRCYLAVAFWILSLLHTFSNTLEDYNPPGGLTNWMLSM